MAVILLAGCESFGGGPGHEATAAETLTPAPVPEVTAEPATLPPGVTGDGVPNANALFGAHFSALEGESYTLHVRAHVDSEVSEHHFRIENDHRYLRSTTLGSYGQNSTTFADGDAVYVRSDFDDVPYYARGNVTERPTSHTVRLSTGFLRLEDARVAKTLLDGEIYYKIHGSYDDHPRAESLKDFSISAVVSQNGLIRSSNISYTVLGNGVPTNVTRSSEYSNVGTTTVERSAWVGERWGTPETDNTASPPTPARRRLLTISPANSRDSASDAHHWPVRAETPDERNFGQVAIREVWTTGSIRQ